MSTSELNNLELLRYVSKGFIYLGGVASFTYLALALPNVGSFTGFLLTLADVIGRLSTTVGVGAVLLALAEIAAALREKPQPGPQLDTEQDG